MMRLRVGDLVGDRRNPRVKGQRVKPPKSPRRRKKNFVELNGIEPSAS
jgi:hypothetical protein